MRFGLLGAVLLVLPAATGVADDRGWDFQPYRIRAVLAIDVPGGLAEQLTSQLPVYLQQRVAAAIGGAWSFDLQVAKGELRQAVFTGVESSSGTPGGNLPAERDKLLLVAVHATPFGFELIAREFDRLVQRWGTPLRRESRQAGVLGEQLFDLVWQAVAPLARFELDPSDEHRVLIYPRAAELFRPVLAEPLAAGEIYLPVLRRTGHGGEVVEGGLQVVPWTYIESEQMDSGKTSGRILSGNRAPFGVRRQGRVEQIAIAIRSSPDETALRFTSRSNPAKPLIGYEVFSQASDGHSATLLGTSDSTGRLSVRPGDARIQTLIIKNGNQLLARLPVVAGAEPELEIPLPDDEVRLAAEARLAALREDLVDVVARRNILIARIRQKIERDDFAGAQDLLRALDELPGRSQFSLTLSTAARMLRSDDPPIQRRIDQLFEATKSVLAQYLDPRQINELHSEFSAARRE